MELMNKDFLEFIGFLEARKVKYLVVGGYAVALHGFPRYTGDIDFFVALDEFNASALVEVFTDFGFEDIGLTSKDFLVPDFVVEVGREPRKIQVLTGIDGVFFDECYVKHVTKEIAGLSVHFISKDDLIKNKIASGRSKDLIDVIELQKLT